jgi:hypothetical protein
MQDNYVRTVRAFTEDLLSNGRTAKQIIIIAENSHWQTKVNEVKTILLEFSGKFKKKFTTF